MPDGGRIIAGTARGIRLAVAGSGTRPLTDRVKESLFSTLESDEALVGSFLDLFAGSGAAGIEALSRGAREAVFVERDRKACESIRINLDRARLDSGHVVCKDVLGFLAAEHMHIPFATVFVDPPYDSELLAPTLELLGQADVAWVAADGVVVTKHFWRDDPPELVGSLVRDRQKRFGETMLTFYTRQRRSDLGL